MLVFCDECGYKMELAGIEIQLREWGNGLEEHYFSCPECKKVYTSQVTDEPLRELIKKKEELRIELTRMTEQLVSRSDELKSLIEYERYLEDIQNDLKKLSEGED